MSIAQEKPHGRPRAVALFGGSFDPIHVGHMAVARAAQRRFHLDEVHFITTGRPPHKLKHALAPFPVRYAMVALACAEHPHYVASLAEAGEDPSASLRATAGGHHTSYSIDTVRHFHRRHPHDRLYFVVGADSFLQIPTWKEYEALLESCDFIVASRPGFRMEALQLVIPPELLGRPASGHTPDRHTLLLRRTRVHLMDTVTSHISGTEIRRRRRHRQPIRGLVPLRVEEYILKQALYT